MSALRRFFEEIDAAWVRAEHPPVTLSVIGSTALMLQTAYSRITKDSDVIETDLLPSARADLLAIAGPDSALFQRHRLYIDIVTPGLPFLPQKPLWQPLASGERPLERLTIRALDVIDVVVSKFKRFNANDRADITAMVERDLVQHERLVERFLATLDFHSWDERCPSYARNFNAIERDAFLCDETEFEFPEWM